MSVPLALSALHPRCFQGVVPSVLATADAEGVPNVTLISQVHHVDGGHVALSRQFFNKTTRNLDANPRAAAPRLDDTVALEGRRSELRGLQWLSERINRAPELAALLDTVLEALDAWFGFRHTMLLVADEATSRLVALGSRGYGEAGIGAEVAVGEGLVGIVARERRVLRISGLDRDLAYGRAIRRQVIADPSASPLAAEIPLPGLEDPRSALVIPLVVGDHLVGVLAAESRDPVAFDEWHEAYLEVLGNHIALGLERASEPVEERKAPETKAAPAARPAGRGHRFVFYRNDDCLFVDGEYLIRNLPGRILRKLLVQFLHEGRTAFTNRELRLDASLGLPPFRDNLESRLVLLRRRLEQKCPDVRLEPAGRGRFTLVAAGPVELEERDSA